MVYPVLKNPNNSPHKKEEASCNDPHRQSKWLEKSPRICLCLFDRSNYNKSRFHIRLRKIYNLCPICSNSNVSNGGIKFLKRRKCYGVSWQNSSTICIICYVRVRVHVCDKVAIKITLPLVTPTKFLNSIDAKPKVTL